MYRFLFLTSIVPNGKEKIGEGLATRVAAGERTEERPNRDKESGKGKQERILFLQPHCIHREETAAQDKSERDFFFWIRKLLANNRRKLKNLKNWKNSKRRSAAPRQTRPLSPRRGVFPSSKRVSQGNGTSRGRR